MSDVGDHEHGDRDDRHRDRSSRRSDAQRSLSNRDAVMTPCNSPSFITAISGLRSRAMSAATSMMVSSALADGMSSEVLGQHVAHRLAAQLVRGLVGHRLVITPASDGIVLDVLRHDEPHHLRGGQDRVRLARRVGYDDPGQPVLGEHARRVQRIGVDGYHGKFLGDFSACMSAPYDCGRASYRVVVAQRDHAYRLNVKLVSSDDQRPYEEAPT